MLTNEEIFSLQRVPKELIIIGGGPIGVEMATAFAGLGSKVTLLATAMLSRETPEIAQRCADLLTKQGVTIINARPIQVENGQLHLSNHTAIPDSKLYLSAIGRTATIDLGLEHAGVAIDDRGIVVDKTLKTTNPSIYALGDCIGGPQFTHLAAHQGAYVVKKFALPFARYHQPALPRVTFTKPAIATVGNMTKKSTSYILSMDFSTTDRAKTITDDTSWGQLHVDRRSGKILGATLLGPFAEDLITFFTLAIDQQVPLLSLGTFITPYPTYASIINRVAITYLVYLRDTWKSNIWGSATQLLHYVLQ
jgi:pyruvate/2-oxoglutarate dehydrogenase complex dihydrolipoamide dehydrogenase (E3) component